MILTSINLGQEHWVVHYFSSNHDTIDQLELLLDLLCCVEASIDGYSQVWEILSELEDRSKRHGSQYAMASQVHNIEKVCAWSHTR